MAPGNAILPASFLGGLGIHKLCLDQVGQDIPCFLFFRTSIPAILAIIGIIRHALMSAEPVQ